MKPAGWHHTEEAKKKMRESHLGKPGSMLGKHHSEEARKKIGNSNRGNPGPMLGKHHTAEIREKIRLNHLGKPRGPYTQERINKAAQAHVTHHRDFDHQNDFPENRHEMTRQSHNSLHRQSGRRAIVFVKNALEKGVVTKQFYENFLAYINQEDQLLSEIQTVSEGKTSETIN